MALLDTIVAQLREHIGFDPDFSDDDPFKAPTQFGSLETLYNLYVDVDRVALYVWRVRLGNHQNRAFDVAQEGNWIARSQKTRFLKSMVDKYERRAGDKSKGRNAKITSAAEDQANITTTVAP